MDFINVVKQGTEIAKIVSCILLLFYGEVFGQTTIFFNYKNPRTDKPMTASNYLNDFAVKSKRRDIGCYEMGSYRFHVKETGVIDSVAFYGNIHSELKALGEKSIRESQAYWKCEDCKKTGGHWFTIPVYVAFTCAGDCVSNPVYDQSLAFWNRLFTEHNSQQVSIGRNEWLLAPMYAICMK